MTDLTLAPSHLPGRPSPSPREKAAIIVRLLLAEGSRLPLSSLPDHLQAALAEQMGQMRLIDRATLSAVVDEFVTLLEDTGLAFPAGVEGALGLMDGHISTTAASRLRRLAGTAAKADPWDTLASLPPERLLPVLTTESTEVAAVMLSKLPVPKAAELLTQLPGDQARRIAYAISLTGGVDPETVRRIGLSLAAQLDAQPARAFEAGPVERVGAILNVSPSATRDRVLDGLDQQDAGFAAEVRKAIFTYAHIPARIAPRDLPKIIRLVDPAQLTTALAASAADPRNAAVADFILANISQRMAQSLREEAEALGSVREADAEAATGAIIAAIRQLESAGEITLQRDDR
ncbi:flagellar motor switch protein FliG [Paragemmobacter straminiformis]|uniref:Flagellar motor switch protein FliG n=1 Tax=Paragemmobacter straminiformis TaxID=2045119 RepID=A0A842I8H6_9RHOB|nr:FliG C-terminal domain-containing protein [Gemmobacter straminiformis]MBC2835881.1 flagellar motor switch protein FliG [Gemmobacter straminiformis]